LNKESEKRYAEKIEDVPLNAQVASYHSQDDDEKSEERLGYFEGNMFLRDESKEIGYSLNRFM